MIDATQYSGLLPGLQAGTYDFIAAPTTVTPERAENLLFVEGYLNTDYQFVTRKGTPKITDLKQLAGKTIAVNKGSAYESWARDLADEIGWTVESYGTNTTPGRPCRRPRLCQRRRQYGVGLSGEEQPPDRAVLPAFDRPRLVGALPTGQREAQG